VIRQVFEFKEISLHFDARTGNASMEFYSGGPNAAINLDATLTLPAGSAPTTKTFQLGYVGTVYRLKAIPNASGTLKLFSGTLMVRTLGVYLDGTQSDVWDSEEIAVAI
jgi:hypothetical protein